MRTPPAATLSVLPGGTASVVGCVPPLPSTRTVAGTGARNPNAAGLADVRTVSAGAAALTRPPSASRTTSAVVTAKLPDTSRFALGPNTTPAGVVQEKV